MTRIRVAHVLLALSLLIDAAVASAQSVNITLKNGTDAERHTKEQLERLLSMYNVGKYTFTHEVIIDEKAIPHSHPVLTLHTRHSDSDDLLLSTYVHEQFHWFLSGHQEQTDAAENDLRKLYPKVPVAYPEGANDEESGYLHLITCYLEMIGDRDLMGNERTAKAMTFWSGDHYTWIYKTVLQDEAKIGAVVKRHGLAINW